VYPLSVPCRVPSKNWTLSHNSPFPQNRQPGAPATCCPVLLFFSSPLVSGGPFSVYSSCTQKKQFCSLFSFLPVIFFSSLMNFPVGPLVHSTHSSTPSWVSEELESPPICKPLVWVVVPLEPPAVGRPGLFSTAGSSCAPWPTPDSYWLSFFFQNKFVLLADPFQDYNFHLPQTFFFLWGLIRSLKLETRFFFCLLFIPLVPTVPPLRLFFSFLGLAILGRFGNLPWREVPTRQNYTSFLFYSFFYLFAFFHFLDGRLLSFPLLLIPLAASLYSLVSFPSFDLMSLIYFLLPSHLLFCWWFEADKGGGFVFMCHPLGEPCTPNLRCAGTFSNFFFERAFSLRIF